MSKQNDILTIVDTRKRARKPLSELAIFKSGRFHITRNKSGSLNANTFVEFVPLNQINTALDLFQNRKAEFSERSVNRIVNAVKDGSFRFKVFDPVLLWKNPENGKLFILSGHSRTESFRRLAKADTVYQGKRFNTIPAKIIEISFDEAREIALESNTLSEPESSQERARYYRQLFKNGTELKELKNIIKRREDNNANKILNFVFLNPDGNALEFVERIEGGEVSSNSRAVEFAYWIGNARMKFPQLTDQHENELFKWLATVGYGDKSGQVSTITQFVEKVKYWIERQGAVFDATKPLNVNDFKQTSTGRRAFEEKRRELENLLKKAKADKVRKRKELIKQLEAGKITRQQLDLALNPLENTIIYYQREIIKHSGKLNNYIDADKMQKTLFGLGKPYMKLEFEDNDELLEFQKFYREAKAKQLPTPPELLNANNLNLNGIGAAEVLRQNENRTKRIERFVPTYTQLKSYNYLLSGIAEMKIKSAKNLMKTLEFVKDVTLESVPQVRKLAQHLKAATLPQTAFNIWHFLHMNIKFHNDTAGKEEIKNAVKTWTDKKGDCDDFTVFASAILLALGYEPTAYIVAFNHKPYYQHIYATVNGFVVDPVLDNFEQQHPKNITKHFTMSFSGVSGLGATSRRINCLQSMPYNDACKYADVVEMADDVKPDNTLVFADASIGKIAGIAVEAMDIAGDEIMLQGLGDDTELQEVTNAYIIDELLSGLDLDGTELGSLGRRKHRLKKLVQKSKKRIKKAAKTVQSKAKVIAKKAVKIAKAAPKAAGRAAKGVIKTMSKAALVAPRVAFLALLKLNFLGIAAKLFPSYYSLDKAENEGLNISEFKKLVKARGKIDKMFELAGGKRKNLKKAIRTGRAKKAVNEKGESVTKTGKKLKKHSVMYGLGEPVTIAASVATATPFLVKITKWLKTVDFGKLFQKASEIKQNIDTGKELVSSFTDGKGKSNGRPTEAETDDNSYTDEIDNQEQRPDKDNNTGLLIAAAAAAAGIFLLTKK